MKFLKRINLANLDTRGRVVLSSFLIAISSFILLNPLLKSIGEYFSGTEYITFAKISQRNNLGLAINWEVSNGFGNSLSDFSLEVSSSNGDVDNFEIAGETFFDFNSYDSQNKYNFKLTGYDLFGKISTNSLVFSIDINEDFQDKIIRYEMDFVDQRNLLSKEVWNNISIVIITILVFLLTAWSLFFNFNKITLFTTFSFPSIVFLSFLVLFVSIINVFNNFLFGVVASIILGILTFILAYITILTANIMLGATFMKLPLEQAGKAVHFIISLVSVYLCLIFVYSQNINLIYKIAILVVFVFYFSLSGLSFLKESSKFETSVYKSAGITLVIALTMLYLSIWPVNASYIMLTVALIYYISLNIALETRRIISKYIYIEYGVLIFASVSILIISAVWGVLGTLF